MEKPLIGSGDISITNAYISDAVGKPMPEGQFVTLEPLIGPTVRLSQSLNYGKDPATGAFLNAWVKSDYTITQKQVIGTIDGIVASQLNDYKREGVDLFEIGKSSFTDSEYGEISLTYAHFSPPKDDKKNPIIIWLHGGGEGGTDPTIPLAANKAVAFADEEWQAAMDGAYVLVPQTTTRWMHGPSGEEGSGVKKDASSIYTRAVQDLVENFVSNQPDIDTNRIYIAGASNGGFLTARLAIDNPDYYAAALPVCEPLNLEYVSEDELKAIVNMPMWLVTAANDGVVKPYEFPVPLYGKLRAMGAKNVHMSILPSVTDLSGTYKKDSGEPFEYFGHFSWIPTFNGDLAYIEGGHGNIFGPDAKVIKAVGDNKVVNIMDWLAAQSR